MARKEVWAINRMTDKRLIGFQHPVNPVILSKTQVALLQIYGGAKPLNATGWQPILQELAAGGKSNVTIEPLWVLVCLFVVARRTG
jgi:hypothetical protein